MEENKINILFKQINLDEETRQRLSDLSLEKVKVNEKQGSWTFVLKSKEILSLEDYKLLTDKSRSAFRNIKNVSICINPEAINYDYLKDYFSYALTEVKDILIFSSIFQDNLIEKDNNYYIEVSNTEEENQVNSFLPKLNYLLNLYGFNLNLEIYLNIEKENSVKEEIKKELKDTMNNIPVEVPKQQVTPQTTNQTSEGKPQYRRSKKEDDPNVIVGRSIKDNPIQIKSIVGESDNITIEGYVFGTDYFESSKTDFKIITLKITDYSDSIYCKVFARGDEEYGRLKKELKDGKWLIIRGYTKNDQYSKELVLNARDICKVEKQNDEITDNN